MNVNASIMSWLFWDCNRQNVSIEASSNCFIKMSGSAVVSHMYLTGHHHSACAESEPPSFIFINKTNPPICICIVSLTPWPQLHPIMRMGILSPLYSKCIRTVNTSQTSNCVYVASVFFVFLLARVFVSCDTNVTGGPLWILNKTSIRDLTKKRQQQHLSVSPDNYNINATLPFHLHSDWW